ncbi:MAG: MarP family serine protease [Corynebacterium sp.]|nr:MarP family serine protease [Corynebacterium sp.]
MSPELIVDAALVVISLIALVAGWRQGAFASIFSAIGVIIGIAITVLVLPYLGDSLLLALCVLIFTASVGNLVGGLIGHKVRASMASRTARRADSLVGAAFQLVAFILVAWFFAMPLATSAAGPVRQAVAGSRILRFTDEVTPAQLDNLPAYFSALLSENGLPPLVSPFQGSAQVAAPNIMVEDTAMVEAVRPSIIHVVADAAQCERRLMGTAFVIGEDYMITNAHVVAGADEVRADTINGFKDGRVVLYNPDVDVAVVYVPGLDLPVLQWAEESAQTGDDAIVMGFPESGPFEASPARIRDRITVDGPNIYATARVDREAYSLRGSVRHGNSGGPLFDTEGHVLGVVFGTAVDETDTGYALTANEVARTIGDFAQLTEPVATGACVA